LGRNAEGVRNTIEEGKHCCNVHRFRDLFFPPSRITQALYIFVAGPVGGVGHQFHIRQQRAFAGCKARFVQLAFNNCLDTFIVSSLSTQEVGVAVESIRTAVQVRDVTGDHFFVTSREVPFRKMQSI
jgi:hypothetical protein